MRASNRIIPPSELRNPTTGKAGDGQRHTRDAREYYYYYYCYYYYYYYYYY